MKTVKIPTSIKILNLIGNLSLLRAFHYVLMTFFGFLVALSLAPITNVNALSNLIISAFAVFFAFEASVLLNDLSDSLIDAENKKRTPLILDVLSRNEIATIALVFVIISILLANLVSNTSVILICISLMFSLIYNFNPLRLKRYALLSTFVLGLITVICVLVGFISTKSLLLFDFPTKYALLVLVFVTLCFGIKDLKDIKGDKLHKVLSLPVLLGEGKARIIFSLFVAISYFLAAILTGSGILFLLAFAFSISNFLLLVKLRSNELPIILSYFVFSIFFCFFALF